MCFLHFLVYPDLGMQLSCELTENNTLFCYEYFCELFICLEKHITTVILEASAHTVCQFALVGGLS
jgi:hypothetical protein